jgi:ferric-dicitrate binding protein FerR (iron transport regulator)
VRSGDVSLRVYGTQFNLNTYSEGSLELVLVEGSVGFRGKPEQAEKMLRPDQRAVVDTATGESEITEAYTRQYVAWKDSDLVFRDEPLGSVMEKLGRMYDLDVVYESDAARALRFDLNMPRYENITSLFYYLEKISDARFRLDGRVVYIDMRKK